MCSSPTVAPMPMNTPFAWHGYTPAKLRSCPLTGPITGGPTWLSMSPVTHADSRQIRLQPAPCISCRVIHTVPTSTPKPKNKKSSAHWNTSSRPSCWKARSEEHTSELQSRGHLVCRLLLEKKKRKEIYQLTEL